MSDFEKYRVRHLRTKALENLYITTKRVLNMAASVNQSERIRLLADLQGAIEEVEKHPVPRIAEN